MQALPDARPLPRKDSRRQQVLPEPQPISRGSICHGSPAWGSTQQNAGQGGAVGDAIAAEPTDRRPRRVRACGRRGSMRAHTQSIYRAAVGTWPTVPSSPGQVQAS